MKKILILGAGVSQLPTISASRKLGIESIVVDENKDALYKKEANKFFIADIKDYEKVLKIARKEKIDGIVCSGTDFPFTASYVAEKMYLPGIDTQVAKICSNKVLQREFLKKEGFLVPDFILISDKSQLFKVKQLNFPIVIKPVDNMGARGSKKIDTHEELETAYDEALKYSRLKQIIIEEFIEGIEFSIDSLIYDNTVHICGFADRHFMLLPYFIENGHTVPSILDLEIQKYINDVFIKAVKSLKINLGAAKGDIKLTDKGIMIGEIAARISGGFLSGWTYPYSSGVFPHENLIRIHLGIKPQNMIEQNLGFSAERCLLSIPGKIKSIVEVTKNYPSVKLVHLHVKKGDEVNFPYNNPSRCGSVISFDKERSDAIYHAQIAVTNIILRLEPNNKRTINWLNSENKFLMYKIGSKEIDWHEADIQKNLSFIKKITSIPIKKIIKNKNFWKWFYKGGIQGGLFAIDSL